MGDNKVIIFGSFTEEETRSFLAQQVGRNDYPSGGTTLQFGSLDFAALNAFGNVGAEKKADISGSLTKKIEKLVNINEACTNEGTPQHKAQYAQVSQSNGSIDCSVVEYGMDSLSLSSIRTSGNELDHATETVTSPEAHDSEDESFCNGNDSLDSSPDAARVGISPKIVHQQAQPVKKLLPRGLINPGNLCFLNATMQALLYCSPFVRLLQDLRSRDIQKVDFPTLYAFTEFVSEFDLPEDSSLPMNEKVMLESGKSFVPTMFDSVLKHFTPDLPNSFSGRPRQEDAQEFLSFVMDKMHNELLKLEGQASNLNGESSLISLSEEDGWETVGPKNRTAVTRTQSFVPSELSEIFGGQLRSVVRARGNKASATIQPFLLLHLDILPEAVDSIEDALHLFAAAETLDGYRTSAGKAGVVTASKSVKIQKLSKILVLHLMRFSYESNGSTKLHKPVRFPLDLVLGRDLLVSPTTEGRRYKLVATITHHGRDPSKGHYTTDARYADGQWLRFDDASVIALGTGQVLHEQAYVLFYKQV